MGKVWRIIKVRFVGHITRRSERLVSHLKGFFCDKTISVILPPNTGPRFVRRCFVDKKWTWFPQANHEPMAVNPMTKAIFYLFCLGIQNAVTYKFKFKFK